MAPTGPTDRYIQIKNISQDRQDLSRFTVVVASSPSKSFDVKIPSGTILQSGEVYVIANPQGCSGPVVHQFLTGGVQIPDRFFIMLLDPSGFLINWVSNDASWGADPAPVCPDALALIRRSNTDDNAADFYCGPRAPGLPGPVARPGRPTP
ncbi:lamin tail domain-containing protein [Kutzneria buriramensis]|uniref:Lamin tail-like protein n=1 Tax=Kutzneria buriramensis TaxID=1045776 RepID=A0A3E0GTX2_9PSEU|nr:lamin tail domain-containing protein [Kutzneria buriramensis]REH27700.1 hypothetical protein BCF44_1283 [Kutzneria buriramensis]